MAHLPSIAGVNLWKARTDFRVIKSYIDCHLFALHEVKRPFLACIANTLSLPSKQKGIRLVEPIDRGSPKDFSQQAIDFCIDFISNWKNLYSTVFLTSGISRHTDVWRPVCCAEGLICQPYLLALCLDCFIVSMLMT